MNYFQHSRIFITRSIRAIIYMRCRKLHAKLIRFQLHCIPVYALRLAQSYLLFSDRRDFIRKFSSIIETRHRVIKYNIKIILPNSFSIGSVLCEFLIKLLSTGIEPDVCHPCNKTGISCCIFSRDVFPPLLQSSYLFYWSWYSEIKFKAEYLLRQAKGISSGM